MNDLSSWLLVALVPVVAAACGASSPGARAELRPGLIMRYMVTGALTAPDITYEVGEDGLLTFSRIGAGENYTASAQLTEQDLVSLQDRLTRAAVCEIPSRTDLLADARTSIWDVRMGVMDCRVMGQLAAGDRFPAALEEVVDWLIGKVDTGVDEPAPE